MAKKKVTKGKRYTAEEKQEVLDYVSSVDTEKGRGGVAAAARQFGITPLTVTAWKKKANGTSGGSGKGAVHGVTSQSRVLHRLGAILDEIETKKNQITALESEYTDLKKKV